MRLKMRQLKPRLRSLQAVIFVAILFVCINTFCEPRLHALRMPQIGANVKLCRQSLVKALSSLLYCQMGKVFVILPIMCHVGAFLFFVFVAVGVASPQQSVQSWTHCGV